MAQKECFLNFIFIQFVLAQELNKLGQSSFGHTYVTHPARSGIECSTLCLQEDACNSAAFAHIDKSCELNNRSPLDFPYTNVTVTPYKDLYYLNTDPCPEPWVLYNRHCYLLVLDQRTWNDSEDNCQTMGAYITDILDTSETAFVTELGRNAGVLGDGTPMWIGMFTVESLQWTSGKPVDYINFSRRTGVYETGDCLTIGNRGGWEVSTCDDKWESLCKKRHY